MYMYQYYLLIKNRKLLLILNKPLLLIDLVIVPHPNGLLSVAFRPASIGPATISATLKIGLVLNALRFTVHCIQRREMSWIR